MKAATATAEKRNETKRGSGDTGEQLLGTFCLTGVSVSQGD